MKKVLICSLILFAATCLRAATVKIVSPDTCQTYAYSDAIDHFLFWNARDHSLYAYVTFSNHRYSSRAEPRVDQSFVFRFPGVEFDAATNAYYAEDEKGQRVPVALRKRTFLSTYIDPLPGTVVFLLKDSGSVAVTLTADTQTGIDKLASHWAERDEQWSLENLVRNVAGH